MIKDILKNIEQIHDKKAADYASVPFENFHRSAELMSWFLDNQDKAFVNLIGTKLARLATLLNKKDKPNNESIEDSFLDLCTYCVLWYAHYQHNHPCTICMCPTNFYGIITSYETVCPIHAHLFSSSKRT